MASQDIIQDKILDILKRKHLDAILLLNTSLSNRDPAINYFIGHTLEYVALVFTERKKHIILPELEYKIGERISKQYGFSLKIIKDRNFTELLKSLKVSGRIGINFESITLCEHNLLKKSGLVFVDVSDELAMLRVHKRNDEILKLEIAAEAADRVFSELFKAAGNNHKTRLFKTEEDIQQFILDKIASLRLKPSFKPIVASGVNSCAPHHDSSGKLSRGFCIIDLGVKYKGYCSDITRTVYFGSPSKKEIESYKLVLDTNKSCMEYVRAGKGCLDIYNHAQRILGTKSEYFIHGLGHGIGIEVHEAPRLSKSVSKEDILDEGMAFTIEPGIYIKGKYGVRIEDDVVILPAGKKKILTNTTRDLLCFRL